MKNDISQIQKDTTQNTYDISYIKDAISSIKDGKNDISYC
jgi:hypothetical protein